MNRHVDTIRIDFDRRVIRSRRRCTFIFPCTTVVGMLLIQIILYSQHSIDGFNIVQQLYPQRQEQQQYTQRNYLISSPKTESRIALYLATKQQSTPTRVTYDIATSTTSQTATATTATTTKTNTVGWEDWCIEQLQQRYNEALRIKCPFFRRRASDVLDSFDMILQFLVIRHKSLPLIDLTSRLHSGSSSSSTTTGTTIRNGGNYIQQSSSFVQSTGMDKLYHLPVEEMMAILIEDWKVTNHKGYYVTGKLSTFIYHDDTIFDGPDPDMPVKGLYKYINAASQLFDTKHTFCELLSIEQEQVIDVNSDSGEAHHHHHQSPIIVAKWKMHGRLRLPWKPIVPEWTGTTHYYIHPITGLIYQHIETWDISVLQAFVQTLFPKSITQYIYRKDNEAKIPEKCYK
jgi:hypothetical protein